MVWTNLTENHVSSDLLNLNVNQVYLEGTEDCFTLNLIIADNASMSVFPVL